MQRNEDSDSEGLIEIELDLDRIYQQEMAKGFPILGSVPYKENEESDSESEIDRIEYLKEVARGFPLLIVLPLMSLCYEIPIALDKNESHAKDPDNYYEQLHGLTIYLFLLSFIIGAWVLHPIYPRLSLDSCRGFFRNQLFSRFNSISHEAERINEESNNLADFEMQELKKESANMTDESPLFEPAKKRGYGAMGL